MTNTKTALLMTAALAVGLFSGFAFSASGNAQSQDLCGDYPELCQTCSDQSCSQGKSGWLCCSRTGTCVEADGSCPTDYIFGYCKNYTVDGTGAAICHE